MARRFNSTPVQLILLAILGTLIVCAIFFAPATLFHTASLAIRLMAGFGLLAAGLALFLKSLSELKEGVRNQRWPEAQIAPIRRICESPFYTACSLALLIAFAALAIPSRHHRGLGWTFYLLSQLLLQLRIAVVPPRRRVPSPTLDWQTHAPIQSEHWGER